MKRALPFLRAVAIWGVSAYLGWAGWRSMVVSFRPERAWANMKRLASGKPIEPAVQYGFELGRLIKAWRVHGPLKVAIPPQYASYLYGNAGMIMGFTNLPGVSFLNAPFPHPALHISRPGGGRPYEFDSRPINAALVMPLENHLWPYGFTAFIDFVHSARQEATRTPVLAGLDGKPVEPVLVRSTSRLTRVFFDREYTRIVSAQWSPIIWEYPRPGRLAPGHEGDLAIERDGAMVSWVPPLPSPREPILGLMLLQKSAPENPAGREPEWLAADEKIRRMILAGAAAADIAPLLAELDALYPGHPLLDHYRVVSALHGPDFPSVWLAHQRRGCDLTTWQLLPWTDVRADDVAALPCMVPRPTAGSAFMEHVLGAVLLRFRDQPNNPVVTGIAPLLLERSYLAREPNGFNFVTSDFAQLWLQAQ